MLLALAAMLLAVARPTATITLPLAERTIMLAMDVSGSMRADRRQAQPAGGVAGSGQGLREGTCRAR
jgi:hypothetical protein